MLWNNNRQLMAFDLAKDNTLPEKCSTRFSLPIKICPKIFAQ